MDLFTTPFFVTSSQKNRYSYYNTKTKIMKKAIFLLIAVFAATTFTTVKAQTVKSLTTDEFKKEVWDFTANKDWKYQGDKPAIIDLYATWCPPCKKLSPILEEIQKQYGDKIQIYKVDVDKEQQIAQLFNATSIPLMIFIPKNGKPFSIAGLRPQAQIEELIAEKLEVKK